MEKLAALEQRVKQLENEVCSSIPHDIDQIVADVCRKFKVPRKSIFGRRRDAETALARQACIWLCAKKTSHTRSRICTIFGRQHGAVQHSIDALNNRMSTDKRIKAEVEGLLK